MGSESIKTVTYQLVCKCLSTMMKRHQYHGSALLKPEKTQETQMEAFLSFAASIGFLIS